MLEAKRPGPAEIYLGFRPGEGIGEGFHLTFSVRRGLARASIWLTKKYKAFQPSPIPLNPTRSLKLFRLYRSKKASTKVVAQGRDGPRRSGHSCSCARRRLLPAAGRKPKRKPRGVPSFICRRLWSSGIWI